ncbi:hypothetical protein ACFYV5_21235 [Streptomyces sp. NPDC003035]|uniref:hypothetical protein n=1 Tax=Streptomyces sp. NPDC003035 TaxID=3364676 RepID=UPI0036823438
MTDNGDDIPRPQQVSRPAELAKPAAPSQADEVARGRRRFARLLDEFRRAAVLVPFEREYRTVRGERLLDEGTVPDAVAVDLRGMR